MDCSSEALMGLAVKSMVGKLVLEVEFVAGHEFPSLSLKPR